MIPALDNLRIVELSRLILHETRDAARLARIREDIKDEGVQRNPIIVAPYGDLYFVLDGAHRVCALQGLGCRLVLVQLVELPERAESWGHLLDAESLKASLHSIEGIEISEAALEGSYLAEVRFYGGERLFLKTREEGIVPVVRVLQRLQTVYPEGDVVRRLDPGKPIELSPGEAVLLYRSFTPEELVEVVSSGEKLPAGITRFIVKERVLNVRYPLELLSEGELPARNAELKDFVRKSWEGNRVRYYREPVVLFE